MFEHNYSLKYKKGFLSHSELWVSHVNPGNTAYRSYCKGSKAWRGNTGEREEPVLQARPGSQSHLNPLPAVRLSEHIGVLGVQLPGSSPWYTANAPAGTARQHRLQRLVYTDPQEMLSPRSPPTAERAALLPLTALMCLCGIQEKRRHRKEISLSSAIWHTKQIPLLHQPRSEKQKEMSKSGL